MTKRPKIKPATKKAAVKKTSRKDTGKASGTRKKKTPAARAVLLTKKKTPAASAVPVADDTPSELTGLVAVRVWRETEPKLRDRLNLLDIDHRILILYCNCWQLLSDCQAVLAKEGRYITMPVTGYVSRHPAAVDEKNAIAQIRQLAAELGMTPKAGHRVKVRSGDGDVLKAFLGSTEG